MPRNTHLRHGDQDTAPVGSEKHCGAGSSGIAVDPYGNVYPCVQWRRPVGNLFERSIREMWGASPVLEEVRELTVEVKRHVGSLAFCPGVAEQRTGDPLKVPREMRVHDEVLKQVLSEPPSPEETPLPLHASHRGQSHPWKG